MVKNEFNQEEMIRDGMLFDKINDFRMLSDHEPINFERRSSPLALWTDLN